jgi:hypothetical protein
MDRQTPCTAFEDFRLIASGPLAEVLVAVKRVVDRREHGIVLIFDDRTADTIEVDLRGSAANVVARLPAPPRPPAADEPRGPGRPRLGVVAREVTLLPRHWEWLGQQPGGASVTLRKLVEQARRTNAGQDAIRTARERLYRFISVMAGNAPGFEEATRALFAGQRARFEALSRRWPRDVRDQALRLSGLAFETLPIGSATTSRKGTPRRA